MSGSLIVSDLEIAIASPTFVTLFLLKWIFHSAHKYLLHKRQGEEYSNTDMFIGRDIRMRPCAVFQPLNGQSEDAYWHLTRACGHLLGQLLTCYLRLQNSVCPIIGFLSWWGMCPIRDQRTNSTQQEGNSIWSTFFHFQNSCNSSNRNFLDAMHHRRFTAGTFHSEQYLRRRGSVHYKLVA